MYRTITLSKLRQPLTVPDADRQVRAQLVEDMSLIRLYTMSYYIMKTQDIGQSLLISQPFTSLTILWEILSIERIMSDDNTLSI